MTPEKYRRLTAEQAEFRVRLSDVLNRVYQPMAVKQLLILQTSGAREVSSRETVLQFLLNSSFSFLCACPQVAGKPLPKSLNVNRAARTPRWLQAACGRLLTDVLVKPNGLLNVVRGVADVSGESSSSHHDPKKFQLVAEIVSSPPKDCPDMDKYCSLMCSQVMYQQGFSPTG